MLGFLWRNRESPALLSKRWMIVWAKRTLTAPALLRILLRRQWLCMRGAQLAGMCVIERCQVHGPGHRLSVGEGCFIGANVELALHEFVAIGRCVVISSGVRVLTASHALHDPAWRAYQRAIHIDDYAWVATGAILLPGVHVGRGAVIGAGAVVRDDVPDYAVVTGNPATIAGKERCREFDYNPALLAAPVEAWVGRASRIATTAIRPQHG